MSKSKGFIYCVTLSTLRLLQEGDLDNSGFDQEPFQRKHIISKSVVLVKDPSVGCLTL